MVPEGESNALARSVPDWPVFDDVHDGLSEVRGRGWRLAILSNTDRDLIDASMDVIGVHFDLSIVAGEIGSYKPAHRHWEVFRERVGGADAIRHVHVAQSLFHDIAPAVELGIPSIWINRLEEPEDPRASRTLMSTSRLASALDELAPR
jgi:2-haloacid dehalogenase